MFDNDDDDGDGNNDDDDNDGNNDNDYYIDDNDDEKQWFDIAGLASHGSQI